MADMREKIQELFNKRAKLEVGGGQQRIEKQHELGKMTARERITELLDPDSFVEIGGFIQHRTTDFDMDKREIPGDGVVTGYGSIDGLLVYIYSQDFTVLGGSLGEAHAAKICTVMDMAVKNGAPIIGINDSGGARVQEGIDALAGFGNIFKRNTLASGRIPQISIILGPCAGGAVYSPAITDFVFMVDRTSQMFITGPEVIRAVTGEVVSKEDLGGAKAHATKSGNAHFRFHDETSCFAAVRKLITYLPPSNTTTTLDMDLGDDPNRHPARLAEIMPDSPNKAYDILDVIGDVVDQGSFIEVHKEYAPNIVVGFAKMNNETIGIIANQPKVLAGSLDVNASDKGARFVRFCDAFNISIVTFTDVPGYFPGVSQEHAGIIRHGAKLLYAFSEATVPKINVILRKAYGGAYIAMNSKHLGADFVYAWPSAEIAVMGPQGAANIIFKNEINSSINPESVRELKIREYEENFANPYVAASRGYVDNVIEPEMTRSYVISALEAARNKIDIRMPKKHGNIPL